MIIQDLRTIIESNKDIIRGLYLRNLLKEALQLYTLNFVYGSNWGENLLFKGGTCLRFCFSLPRLSEDLDFDIKEFPNFKLDDFLADLNDYFLVKWQTKGFTTKVAGNGKQIFLRFPVLNQLDIASGSESETLFLRIDLSPVDSGKYQEEISIKTASQFSFIMKRYSLKDLFSSKIAAILNRSFRKGKGGLITFKGRDYFDLIWFLEKNVTPNYERLQDLTGLNKRSAVKQLGEKVKQVNEEYLFEDLNPLFRNGKFVREFCRNFQELFKSKISLFGGNPGENG